MRKNEDALVDTTIIEEKEKICLTPEISVDASDFYKQVNFVL